MSVNGRKIHISKFTVAVAIFAGVLFTVWLVSFQFSFLPRHRMVDIFVLSFICFVAAVGNFLVYDIHNA